MKVAILQDDFPSESLGGAGIVAENLAIGLKKEGHDIFVITSTTKNDFIEESGGIKIFRLKSRPFGFLKYYFCLYNPKIVGKVKEILEKENPDVVHCHNLHTALSYYCLKLARKSSKKVFLTAHDAMMVSYGKMATDNYIKKFDYRISVLEQIKQAGKQYNPFRNFFIKHYLKNVDKIFAVSYALKNFLNANGIGNVEVIYNGIKVEDFETKIDEVVEFKKRYNLFNKKIIFFGGRVSKSKGAEKILEAMRLIVKMAKDAMLVIAGGGGNYLNHLKNLSQKLNINDYVLFLGQVPHNQMRIIYDAADIVVVPSLYLDPFPTVNLEAMACKKPVVGTCFGGTPEIVQDGVTGYIINPFNVEEMVEKIVDLLENPEKAKQFGEAGYKRVRDDFSLDKQLETMLRWYNKV